MKLDVSILVQWETNFLNFRANISSFQIPASKDRSRTFVLDILRFRSTPGCFILSRCHILYLLPHIYQSVVEYWPTWYCVTYTCIFAIRIADTHMIQWELRTIRTSIKKTKKALQFFLTIIHPNWVGRVSKNDSNIFFQAAFSFKWVTFLMIAPRDKVFGG